MTSLLETVHRRFEAMLGRVHCRAQGEAPGVGADAEPEAAAVLGIAACIFGRIAEQSLLLIGAGEQLERCAARFCAEHPRRVTVAGCTLRRARLLAGRLNAQAIALGDLPARLALHDVVIACSASPLPILGKGMVERAIRVRRHRPILMVDLAVPPDVEPEVAELDDVFLYTAQDVAEIVREGARAETRAATGYAGARSSLSPHARRC